MINAEQLSFHSLRNRWQSCVLLVVMAGFIGLLGWIVWGPLGIWLIFGLVLGLVVFNPSVTPWWVMRLYGAKPISQFDAPGLFQLITELSRRARLPAVPKLFYIPSPVINAFAVGSPKQSAIAITDGVIQRLQPREIAGVLAHEVSHIQHRDLTVMGLADVFSRLTSVMSMMGLLLLVMSVPAAVLGFFDINWGALVLLIFAPNLSALAQLALSRTREYQADLNAAELTGDPAGLASALEKIDYLQGGWMEQLALPGRRVPEPSLLRTHPKTSDRVEKLLSLRANRTHHPMVAFAADNHSYRHRDLRNPCWRWRGLWF